MTNPILSLMSGERLRAHYRDGFWRPETIVALLRGHAARSPASHALRDRARRLTYAELHAAVDSVAADLAGRGVRPGQRVAVWLPSRVEAAIAILACWRNGYVCSPSLHRDHKVADIVELLERTRSAALFAEPGYGADGERHDVFAAAAALPFLRHAYRLERPHPEAPFAGMLSPAKDAPAPSGDPDQVIYLSFTSGTTGTPKGVMHSDNTLLANARALAADWRLGPDSVLYTLSPLSHNLGIGALVTAMAVGGELVLHDLPRCE